MRPDARLARRLGLRSERGMTLLELTIEGVESSRDFHLRVMDDAEFRAGAIEIQWLERRLDSLIGVTPPRDTTRLAVLVAALIADRDRPVAAAAAASSTAATPGGWGRVARTEGLR